MNRSMRRIAIVTIGLLLLSVSLAACQRERPTAEEGNWTVTPPAATTALPVGTDSRAGRSVAREFRDRSIAAWTSRAAPRRPPSRG